MYLTLNMSTRSNIKIVDTNCEVFLYKHSDGYPTGVIPFLKACMNRKVTAIIMAKKLVKMNNTFEITKELAAGIEYYYVVDLESQSVQAYDAGFNVKSNKLSTTPISFTPAELGEQAVRVEQLSL